MNQASLDSYLEPLSNEVRDWLTPVCKDGSISQELGMVLNLALQQPDINRAIDLARYAVVYKEPRVLGWSAVLVACYDDPKAQSLLERLLRHSDPKLRRVALEASQLAEAPMGLRRAISCVADPDLSVSSAALDYLHQAGPARLSPLLEEMLQKGDTASLSIAAEALIAVAKPEFLELMSRCYSQADLGIRKRLAHTMARIGTQEVAEELHLLSQQDPELSGVLRTARSKVVEKLKEPGADMEIPEPADPDAPKLTIEYAGTGEQVSPPVPAGDPRARIEGLLRKLVGLSGSDLHLKAGQPPHLRHDGRLMPMKDAAITRDELLACMRSLSTQEQMAEFSSRGDLDLSFGLPGVARFRLNFLMASGEPALVARLIPTEVPKMEDLGLPQILHEMALSTKGLLLVTGPTGSGKSTTLAAMIDLINSVRKAHIITIEDPVEFIHHDKLSSVTQRELGTDVLTFAHGVRFSLRQDPDVMLVGELRDLETVRAAFQAAGAGRLVLATLHTNSAAKTIERILNMFPPDEQPQARVSLGLTLTGVISQTLVRKNGGGRIALHEILMATGAVRKAIREKQTQSIYGIMESGSAIGMSTLEQGLARLVDSATVTREDAMAVANEPALLGLL